MGVGQEREILCHRVPACGAGRTWLCDGKLQFGGDFQAGNSFRSCFRIRVAPSAFPPFSMASAARKSPNGLISLSLMNISDALR